MTANRGPAAISSGSNSGRVLDTARGILIALRRCPQRPRSTSCTTPLNGTDCRSSK